ncbi:hypothetical protein L1987_20585 [Smallanthus sonchifolius]|uniref:Uncharacterized protein n=1 Tax=Smallanthus sonchifolius TaxID=185202 RepID=A0ACB9ISW3_9ASTR|nr:hypothetical protein L1987_20585 [Smallanthus sonchifolius]
MREKRREAEIDHNGGDINDVKDRDRKRCRREDEAWKARKSARIKREKRREAERDHNGGGINDVKDQDRKRTRREDEVWKACEIVKIKRDRDHNVALMKKWFINHEIQVEQIDKSLQQSR